MNEIWKSGTYRVVQAMRAAGNQPGLIAQWKAGMEAWAAEQPTTREITALRAWLPLWQTRAVYTATELAPIIPALAAFLGFKELCHPRSARRVENRLRYVGLPVLQNADGCDTFVNPVSGRYERYFICERLHFHAKRKISQEDFEREFFTCRDTGSVSSC